MREEYIELVNEDTYNSIVKPYVKDIKELVEVILKLKVEDEQVKKCIEKMVKSYNIEIKK